MDDELLRGEGQTDIAQIVERARARERKEKEEKSVGTKCTTLVVLKPMSTPGLCMGTLTTVTSDISSQIEEGIEASLAAASQEGRDR